MIRLFSACVLLCAFLLAPAEAKQRPQSRLCRDRYRHGTDLRHDHAVSRPMVNQ